MIKVAVITQQFPTSRQPWAGHSIYQTLRPLAELCDLEVFYPEVTYPKLFTPKTKSLKPLDSNWNPAGVKANYIPYPTLPLVGRPLNGFVMGQRLLPHVRRFRPDIVLNYVVYPDGFAAVRIAKALGVPVILKATGSDLNRIEDPIRRSLTRHALRNADVTTTVSEALVHRAIELGADPAHTFSIVNGCDLTVFHPRDRAEARQSLGLDPDAELAVYVGRLDVRKGLIELISASAELHTRRPKFRCYIVGDGVDKPLLEAAIASHNAASYVTLMPSCLTAQVAAWMAASNLVTLPSYNEGCPNVVLEALTSGRPVVATNVGGIPELMDDTCGRLVPPRDVPALTEALDQVLSQPWSAAEISAKHSRSWADVAGEVLRLLEQTLHRN